MEKKWVTRRRVLDRNRQNSRHLRDVVDLLLHRQRNRNHPHQNHLEKAAKIGAYSERSPHREKRERGK